MKGGVILFRGSGADARRYLESDRSRADEYYLEGGTSLAEFSVGRRQGYRDRGRRADAGPVRAMGRLGQPAHRGVDGGPGKRARAGSVRHGSRRW